jgi:hypothetical protein
MQKHKLQPELALILSKQTFELEVIWMDGFAHGQLDLADNFNPYAGGTRERYYWSEGWEAGFYGQEPLFPDFSIDLDSVIQLTAKRDDRSKGTKKMDNWMFGLGAVVGTMALFSAIMIDSAA